MNALHLPRRGLIIALSVALVGLAAVLMAFLASDSDEAFETRSHDGLPLEQISPQEVDAAPQGKKPVADPVASPASSDPIPGEFFENAPETVPDGLRLYEMKMSAGFVVVDPHTEPSPEVLNDLTERAAYRLEKAGDNPSKRAQALEELADITMDQTGKALAVVSLSTATKSADGDDITTWEFWSKDGTRSQTRAGFASSNEATDKAQAWADSSGGAVVVNVVPSEPVR